jgi:chromosome segregation ATPase
LPPGASKTKEDCEKILDKTEHRMKELSKDIENAMKGKSPLADLQGQIGKPGGHMCELEDRMHGIDLEWEKYFTSGCDEYEELRARRKDLHTRYGGMQRRIAKWARQLKILYIRL